MTLSVDSEKITIKNKDNTTKFTSNDRLVFRKSSYVNNNIYVASNRILLPWAHGLDATKDFAVFYIKFNTSTGNLLTSFAGSGIYLPANSTIPSHFDGFLDSNTAAGQQENISIYLIPNYIVINSIKFNRRVIDGTGTAQIHTVGIIGSVYGYL